MPSLFLNRHELVLKLPRLRNLIIQVEDLPSDQWLPNPALLANGGGPPSSCLDEFFPIVSLLLAGSVVVAFHIQTPRNIPHFTLQYNNAIRQPHRLFTSHWIHSNEIQFLASILHILTTGILCEKAMGSPLFVSTTLVAIVVTSFISFLFLPKYPNFALVHREGIGFSTIIRFWMGYSITETKCYWWHRLFCFLWIAITDVLGYAQPNRGTRHHWIGIINGLRLGIGVELDRYFSPKSKKV